MQFLTCSLAAARTSKAVTMAFIFLACWMAASPATPAPTTITCVLAAVGRISGPRQRATAQVWRWSRQCLQHWATAGGPQQWAAAVGRSSGQRRRPCYGHLGGLDPSGGSHLAGVRALKGVGRVDHGAVPGKVRLRRSGALGGTVGTGPRAVPVTAEASNVREIHRGGAVCSFKCE